MFHEIKKAPGEIGAFFFSIDANQPFIWLSMEVNLLFFLAALFL